MNRNVQIAAAIATILGTAAGTGSALAQATNPPTLAQVQSAGVSLYISGSSAAKNAVLGAIQGDICGGASNALTFSSTSNKNFFLISCAPASGKAGADGNTYFNMFYRAEGGSVTGVLPIANNVSINQLDPSQITGVASTTTATPTVTGGSATNGIDDSFVGPLTKQPVQLGIADVEPAALVGNNYPKQYSTGVYGPVNQAGVGAVTASTLFDEVYGIYVNTGTSSTVFTSTPLNLSKQTVKDLLTKNITNWSNVQDTNGNPVTSTSLAVTIVNREAGSGSRAATDLLIAGDVCQSGGASIVETKTANVDYFSTGDVLTAASSVAGAITYATIDQSQTNMTKVNLNGITPGNLAAATGAYDFWVEATYTTNPNVTLSTTQTSLVTYLVSDLQAIATAPHLIDVLAIAGNAGNVSANNTASNANAPASTVLGSANIYVNPFTRSANTCALPLYLP